MTWHIKIMNVHPIKIRTFSPYDGVVKLDSGKANNFEGVWFLNKDLKITFTDQLNHLYWPF